MLKSLLSIDWDYFIPIEQNWSGSYIENKENMMFIWYKRYFDSMKRGINIEKSIKVERDLNVFLKIIRKYIKFKNNIKMYVSDSHKYSYDIAKANKCENVINFDAHSDLGYGGMESLKFEVNCANWLGKLFKDNIINRASIVYSPYTLEEESEFKEINSKFNIKYIKEDSLPNIEVDSIHLCRSGSWTPPWLDEKFNSLIALFNIPHKIIDCPTRNWDPGKLTLADKLYMWM
ncbi:arginase [Clostridium sp.]|jgi:hypothetical protein|uniref:arginase n=1 Tax=Clostridium sp. TaxID=1506 RepID=UPI003A1A8042